MSQIIDLSHVIKADPPDLPDFLRTDLTYNPHSAGTAEFVEIFGIEERALRNGEGPASERLSIGTHSVTRFKKGEAPISIPMSEVFPPAHPKRGEDRDTARLARFRDGLHIAVRHQAPAASIEIWTKPP